MHLQPMQESASVVVATELVSPLAESCKGLDRCSAAVERLTASRNVLHKGIRYIKIACMRSDGRFSRFAATLAMRMPCTTTVLWNNRSETYTFVMRRLTLFSIGPLCPRNSGHLHTLASDITVNCKTFPLGSVLDVYLPPQMLTCVPV